MKLKDSTYNCLKWLAMLFFPALTVLIRVIFSIWGLPYGEEISATVCAINAFLGSILGISNMAYYKQKDEQ